MRLTSPAKEPSARCLRASARRRRAATLRSAGCGEPASARTERSRSGSERGRNAGVRRRRRADRSAGEPGDTRARARAAQPVMSAEGRTPGAAPKPPPGAWARTRNRRPARTAAARERGRAATVKVRARAARGDDARRRAPRRYRQRVAPRRQVAAQRVSPRAASGGHRDWLRGRSAAPLDEPPLPGAPSVATARPPSREPDLYGRAAGRPPQDPRARAAGEALSRQDLRDPGLPGARARLCAWRQVRPLTGRVAHAERQRVRADAVRMLRLQQAKPRRVVPQPGAALGVRRGAAHRSAGHRPAVGSRRRPDAAVADGHGDRLADLGPSRTGQPEQQRLLVGAVGPQHLRSRPQRGAAAARHVAPVGQHRPVRRRRVVRLVRPDPVDEEVLEVGVPPPAPAHPGVRHRGERRRRRRAARVRAAAVAAVERARVARNGALEERRGAALHPEPDLGAKTPPPTDRRRSSDAYERQQAERGAGQAPRSPLHVAPIGT